MLFVIYLPDGDRAELSFSNKRSAVRRAQREADRSGYPVRLYSLSYGTPGTEPTKEFVRLVHPA